MLLRVDESVGEVPADAAEAWQLRSLATGATTLVALRDVGALGISDGYEVRLDELAADGTGHVSFAYIVWMDGPRTARQAEADAYDGRGRIWPAIRSVPGMVRLIVGVATDGAVLAVGLATTAAAVDAAQVAVRQAPPLPGQDPTLLRSADRLEIFTVTAHVRAQARVM